MTTRRWVGTRGLILAAVLAVSLAPSAIPGWAADEQVTPLSQAGRPPASIPLARPDLTLGNANWTAGLAAESEWIWSGNLIPAAFENNLAKLLLQIPATFEEQLPYSTTLIFDEPSFRNGTQMSGFVDRVTRELVISYVAQRRRAWYSMTHHALLGALTGRKHGLDDAEIARKWTLLLDHRAHPKAYTRVERAALRFAEAFTTDPKSYGDDHYEELRAAFREDDARRFRSERRWLPELQAARLEHAYFLGAGRTAKEAQAAAPKARRRAPRMMSDDEAERRVDAHVVELAFLCGQFVALTDALTTLNVPDEEGLDAQLVQHVAPRVIAKVNELNRRGAAGLGGLVPPPVDRPIAAILEGRVRVRPAPLRGTRVPLVSWEVDPALGTRDKGLAVGGVHVGVFGWANGLYGAGGLGWLLLNHPELARTEPPYSLPLIFDEDEWRNGVNTAGFLDRRLKELAIMKVYHSTRPRYGIEHHTMFLFNEYMRDYGAGAFRHPRFDDEQAAAALERATRSFTTAMLHLLDHGRHLETFTDGEVALLDWTQAAVHAPHTAHRYEPALRTALDRRNRAQVAAGVRRLDLLGGDEEHAYRALLDHQVAELAMLVGHMDGLGRILSILRTEGEQPVQVARGRIDAHGLAPELDAQGYLQPTGYFTNRLGFLELLTAVGVPEAVLTANELLVNPSVAAEVQRRLDAGETGPIEVSADEALATGEF